MSDFSKSLSIASSGLRAQSARLRHVAENISNVDTPGYRRKTLSFETIAGSTGPGGVKVGRTSLSPGELTKIYDPNHPLADDTGHFQGSNVQLMMEIADAREAQRSYEANLKMFDQTRQMSSSLMELLRK